MTSYPYTCIARPSGKSYKRRHTGLKSVSQFLTPKLFTTLALAETSVLDYAWHVIADQDDNYLVLFAYLSVVNESGDSYPVITVITAIKLPFTTITGNYTLAS